MKAIGRIIGLALLSGITITTYGKETGKMTDMKNPGVQDEKLQLTEKWASSLRKRQSRVFPVRKLFVPC